jgi:hypothetical protein
MVPVLETMAARQLHWLPDAAPACFICPDVTVDFPQDGEISFPHW